MSQLRKTDLAVLFGTYCVVGITVAVAMRDAGHSVGFTMSAGVLIHSATTQLAFLTVAGSGGSIVVAVLSGWLVASRFGVLAASLSARWGGNVPARLMAGSTSFDPNVGLALQESDERALRRTYWRVTGMLAGGWWCGLAIGAVLGDVVGDGKAWGLDAVFPATLMAIIAPSLRTRQGQIAAAAGAAICLVMSPFVGAGLPVLASALGAVIATWVPRP